MTIARIIQFVLAFAITSAVHAQQRWSLKTADTSLTVTANAGELAITSLSSTGSASDWVGGPARFPLLDHVFINNTSQPVHWKFLGKVRSRTGGETTLRFRSSEPKLELAFHLAGAARPRPGRTSYRDRKSQRSSDRGASSNQSRPGLNRSGRTFPRKLVGGKGRRPAFGCWDASRTDQ